MTAQTAQNITVPLLDLKAQYDTIRAEIEPVVKDVIESQWFIMGPKIGELECEVAGYCGTKHAIGCASGSDAVLLALMAAGVEAGDQVICPSYTFFATAGSIHRLGARPIFADIDPVTYNMDPDHTRELAGKCPRLAAIMPVHLYGQAVEMDAFLNLGEEFGVPIIEDAAQAIGTRDTSGAPAGSRGAIGCFSFFPSKNLGGFGDGGIITTNDDELAERMNILRQHGGKPKYYHQVVGMNSRLDAMQAAVLSVKLKHLDKWHAARAQNAADYTRMFADAGATNSRTPLAEGDHFPVRTPYDVGGDSRHIYNQYVIRVPAAVRNELRDHLRERNIGNEVYYPVPLHMQECFAYLKQGEGDLPNSELAAHETIALPIYPELTAEQKTYVAQTVIAFVGAKAGARV